MILRLLNWQGIAGVAVSAVLVVLLTVQSIETGHWKKRSASFERLYHQVQASFAATVANARAAAEAARSADRANAARVAGEQRIINERTRNDFEASLAAARLAAERLRVQPEAPANPNARRSASMPGLPASAGGASESTREDRLPSDDALIATEQAIQLDELIKWVRQQHAVRVDGMSGERPRAAGLQAEVDNNPAPVASPTGD